MRDLQKRVEVYIDLLNRKNRGPRVEEKNVFISGINTSSFYSPMYAKLYGGMATSHSYSDVIKLLNGRSRKFRPDVIKKDDEGVGFTEIKGISYKASAPHCGLEQVENYAFWLLRRVESGDKQPYVDYSFFRYANGNKNVGFAHMHPSQHIEKLCNETRGLLITPFNLTLLLLAVSPINKMDQTSSDSNWNERNYFKPFGKHLTALQNGPDSVSMLLDGIKSKHKREIAEKCLVPEELYKEDYILRPNVYVNGIHVEQFPISHYKNHDYRKWLSSFKKNHDLILRELLEIKDLHASETEQETIPF